MHFSKEKLLDDDPQKGAAEAKKAKAAKESAVKVALAAVVGAVQGAMGKIGECLAGVGNNASGTSNVDLRDTLNKPWANAGMDGTRIKSDYDVYREKTYNYCKASRPDATDSEISGYIANKSPWEYKFKALWDHISNYNPLTQFGLLKRQEFVNSAINNGFDPKTAEIYGNMAGDFSEGMLFETGFTIVGKGLKAASALKSGEVLSEGEIVAGSGIGNLKGTNVATEAGTGSYSQVKGHHIHAKAALKGDINYDLNKGFSISQDFMKNNGLSHSDMTTKQRQLFKELYESGRPNTLEEHTRIAREALEAGGASKSQIDELITNSLNNLKEQGVINPTRIPWYSK